MRVITNEAFVARRALIGKVGTGLGMVALVAGFLTSLNIQWIIASYVCLIIGLFAFNVGRYNAIRWGTRPRADEIIVSSLKGLDHKYVLVNYYDSLPGNHILVSPLGLFFIETRLQDGEISCEADRWHRKGSPVIWLRSLTEGTLGNPTKDALAGVSGLKKFVVDRLGVEAGETVPLESLVLFTNPRAQVTVSDAVVPVLTPKDLRAHVRTPRGRSKMTPDTYRKLLEMFDIQKLSQAA